MRVPTPAELAEQIDTAFAHRRLTPAAGSVRYIHRVLIITPLRGLAISPFGIRPPTGTPLTGYAGQCVTVYYDHPPARPTTGHDNQVIVSQSYTPQRHMSYGGPSGIIVRHGLPCSSEGRAQSCEKVEVVGSSPTKVLLAVTHTGFRESLWRA